MKGVEIENLISLASIINESSVLDAFIKKKTLVIDEFASKTHKLTITQQITLLFDFCIETTNESVGSTERAIREPWNARIIAELRDHSIAFIVDLLDKFCTLNDLKNKLNELKDSSARKAMNPDGWSSQLKEIDTVISEVIVILQKSQLFALFHKEFSIRFPSYSYSSGTSLHSFMELFKDIYLHFEVHYIQKGLAKVFKTSELDVIEDAFFLFMKGIKRCISSFSLDLVIGTASTIFKIIDSSVLGYLIKKVPLNCTLEMKQIFLSSLNDMEQCRNYSTKLMNELMSGSFAMINSLKARSEKADDLSRQDFEKQFTKASDYLSNINAKIQSNITVKIIIRARKLLIKFIILFISLKS